MGKVSKVGRWSRLRHQGPKDQNGKQSYWRAIGAVWPHGDGEGFNLKLDYLPLNGAEIVIRKPKAETAEEPDTAAETA